MTARDLHVAVDGNDTWSGKLERPDPQGHDGPVASLAGARDALRKHRTAHGNAEEARILVADGTYTLTEPLRIGPADGGVGAAAVVYQAAPGAKPVFSGGRVIGNWQPGPGGIWQSKIAAVADGSWYFERRVPGAWGFACFRHPANIVRRLVRGGHVPAGPIGCLYKWPNHVQPTCKSKKACRHLLKHQVEDMIR